MQENVVESISPDEYEGWVAVAQVENDRYCQGCGYNLRMHAVRRQPATELLVCRCAECGHFAAVSEPAAGLQPWARRLISLAVVAWLGALLAVAGATIAGSLGMHMISLEARTSYARTALPAPGRAVTGQNQVIQIGGGGTVTVPTMFTYQRVVNTEMRDYWVVKFATLGMAMLIAFVGATIVMAALPHWPRLAYLLLFCVLPAIPALIAWLIWWDETPDLAEWGTVQIGHLWLAQVLVGLVAALLGRGPLRLIATILLPSRLRAVLAYLWLVDGKTPPLSAKVKV